MTVARVQSSPFRTFCSTEAFRALIRSRLFLTIAAWLASSPAAAQSTYARSDTLRFRESTLRTTTLTSASGAVERKTGRDAQVSVAWTQGDTAHAWFDELKLATVGPLGDTFAETDGVLRRPFTMLITARGETRRLASPPIPSAIASISEISSLFGDLFLRLPHEPLRRGLAWADTTSRGDSNSIRSSRSHVVTTYRVARDTVIGGRSGFVVLVASQIAQSSEQPVPGREVRVSVSLSGTESGFFVFSVDAGGILARRREGRLSGETTMRSLAGNTTSVQVSEYKTTIDAIP